MPRPVPSAKLSLVLVFTLVTLAGVPAARAGKVQLVAKAGCDTRVSSSSPDARYVGVWTCTDVFLVDRGVGSAVLVSHALGSPTAAGNHVSFSPAVSADGRYVAFRSFASNLAPAQADAPGTGNVFLYDAVSGDTTLISRRATPGTGFSDTDSREVPEISADGRYVLFASEAPDLVAGQVDTSGTIDLFLYDRVAGTLTLVTHASGAATTTFNGQLGLSFLSADGAWVVFNSTATNLVPGQVDGNGKTDVFLYERGTGTMTLVSHANGSPATAANGEAFLTEVTPDGRYAVFSNTATDLVAGQTDANSDTDVFLFDRVAGTTTLISHQDGAPTTAANKSSGAPSVSDDGRFIAFRSGATDLAAGLIQSNLTFSVFVHDRIAGTTRLVSHAPGEPLTARGGVLPKISGDGGFVAFSSSDELLVRQSGTFQSLFLWDRDSGAIVLVTHSVASPTQMGNANFFPGWKDWFLSADGSQVIFASDANDLVAGDTAFWDVFAFDNGLKGRFYTLRPCRLLDTREEGQPFGTFGLRNLYDRCGVPVTAKAVMANVTGTESTGAGHLILFPGDAAAPPDASTLNFGPGQTRANNAILRLASNAEGTLTIAPFVAGGGTVHVVLDVMGYFE